MAKSIASRSPSPRCVTPPPRIRREETRRQRESSADRRRRFPSEDRRQSSDVIPEYIWTVEVGGFQRKTDVRGFSRKTDVGGFQRKTDVGGHWTQIGQILRCKHGLRDAPYCACHAFWKGVVCSELDILPIVLMITCFFLFLVIAALLVLLYRGSHRRVVVQTVALAPSESSDT
uniref:EGF-like domain-containing protein n=1 Tax=Steinernema glaseri TaxID=37863 RepID=A0A1I7ZPH4_9BILA